MSGNQHRLIRAGICEHVRNWQNAAKQIRTELERGVQVQRGGAVVTVELTEEERKQKIAAHDWLQVQIERHSVPWNQTATRERSGEQWSEWAPVCPACAEDAKAELERKENERRFNEEILPGQRVEVHIEAESRSNADPEFETRVSERQLLIEAAAVENYRIRNAPTFRNLAKGAELEIIEQAIIAERLDKYLADEAAKQRKADEEQAAAMELRREKRLEESLRNLAALSQSF